MKNAPPTNTTNKKQEQCLAFPSYDEEDIFNWDAIIVTPQPCQSDTIRVKLKYIERSKPIPVADLWEE